MLPVNLDEVNERPAVIVAKARSTRAAAVWSGSSWSAACLTIEMMSTKARL